jgi:hypothetical protein
MKLRFGVLADYAGQGAANKAILVGIFDTLFNTQNLPLLNAPPFFLFAAIEAHVTEGTEHKATIHLTTGDGRDLPVPLRLEVPFKFAARGPGRAMEGNLVFGMNGLPLPGNGSYEFNILIDGHHLGAIPLYVSEAAQAPQT